MGLNNHQQQVVELLVTVTRTGKPLHVTDPATGLSIVPKSRTYGELKSSLVRKTKEFWRAGRAGFAYTSWPVRAPEEAGIWVFPGLAEAQAKAAALRAEGWTVRLVSWGEEDLTKTD